MTLDELRSQVEDGKCVNLATQRPEGVVVMMDNTQGAELFVYVVHYYKIHVHDSKASDWKYTIRYSGNDYVCAMGIFQLYLESPIQDTDSIDFTCPSCGKHRLECCEDGPYVSEILVIDEEGDFDYGEISASGEVERIQCQECGYVLTDGDTGENIINNEDVVAWIKERQ